MEPVIAQFIPDKDHDQQSTGDPNAQTRNIDEAADLVAQHISPGDFEIIFYHDFSFIVNSNFRRQSSIVKWKTLTH
jgi:hypothetical protein